MTHNTAISRTEMVRFVNSKNEVNYGVILSRPVEYPGWLEVLWDVFHALPARVSWSRFPSTDQPGTSTEVGHWDVQWQCDVLKSPVPAEYARLPWYRDLLSASLTGANKRR
jgi:hypothetical protein